MKGVLNGLSLCTGIGGKELGLQLALGEQYRTLLYCEREAAKASRLVARMEDQIIHRAPIWDDLKTLTSAEIGFRVDIITAGYPCQPFSVAGARAGADDPRHLWPDIRRLIQECRPRLIFCENVAGHLSLGFKEVVQDLEGLGYEVAAGVFPACEAGSPHLRKRLYFLAMADAEQGRLRWGKIDQIRAEKQRAVAERSSCDVGNSAGFRRKHDSAEPREVGGDAQEGWLQEPSGRSGYSIWPSGPGGDWSQASIKPAVFRVADGTSDWADRLRACGEAVIPVVAAWAFCNLADALGVIE